MKGDKVFLDTNLLLYAYDAGSSAKHAVAVRILEDLWKSGNGILSTQVLQEFFVNVTKKIHYAFWDSLVIQSAIEGGARWLLSEDFKDGQRIGDLTIRNPFLHD